MINYIHTCSLQSRIGLCKSEKVATPESGVRISKSLTDPSPKPTKIVLIFSQIGKNILGGTPIVHEYPFFQFTCSKDS